jgi:hypothetical protein
MNQLAKRMRRVADLIESLDLKDAICVSVYGHGDETIILRPIEFWRLVALSKLDCSIVNSDSGDTHYITHYQGFEFSTVVEASEIPQAAAEAATWM